MLLRSITWISPRKTNKVYHQHFDRRPDRIFIFGLCLHSDRIVIVMHYVCGSEPRSGLNLLVYPSALPFCNAYEFVVQPRLAGHGPTLFAGLSKRVDLRLVSRLEFGPGAVAMRYEPRR